MSTARGVSWSFRSRVAMRVFLLCAICSLVPTLVIGVAVYTSIAWAEKESARAQLQDLAKRYGILLQDRLYEAERAMLDSAQRRMLGGQSAGIEFGAAGRLATLSVMPLDTTQTGPRRSQNHADGPLQVLDESLAIVQRDGRPTVQLALTVRNSAGRQALVEASLQPDFLWNSDVVEAPGVQLCVTVGSQTLDCSGADNSARAPLDEKWQLYLNAHYKAPAWEVRATQPRELDEASLASARSGFPLLAGVALLIALLIGSLEVRRTHGPLSELLTAFRSMARGKFTQVGLQSRRDEYASIGQAFNQLSRTLRRQFRLLATFERMDQAILERPSVEELVAAMLPRLPQMLDCECVGLVLRESDGRFVLACSGEAGAGSQVLRTVWPDDAQASAQLQRLQPNLHWTETPVRLAGVERGRMLCGRKSARAVPHALRRQVKGVARRFAVALRNEERERLLVRQAYYDELTKLPNRRLLQDRVQQALREAAAGGSPVAFLYLDLDRFKTLNDSLGHRSGDELLMQLAQRLSGCVAAGDTVSRLGGDEFVVLLRNTSMAETLHQGERILNAVRETVVIGGVVISPQASIGAALYPQDGEDFDTLLRNADAAMYRGKATGGGQIVFFEDRMNEVAVRRLRVEAGLRRALGAGQLLLHYQPKVSLATGGLHGVEGLLRWSDAELGVVGPAEFVAVAEETGLIHELGKCALEQAIAFCRRCMDASVPIGHVAVNVSMLQLRNADLLEYLQRQLQSQRVPPGMLQIEVTESSIMHDARTVSALLARIRALGVRIVIDDFGTGYSSLAVLQQLPVDLLKIDRAFVVHIAENSQSLELVRAMLAVSRALGLQAVAEGVETEAQAQLLAQHGCEYAQGYLFGRAMPEREIVAFAQHGGAPEGAQPWIMRA
jgi:diguanylate cyclase (GGDEF)-like protein